MPHMGLKSRAQKEPVELKSHEKTADSAKSNSSILFLGTCILGIYASFLTWGILQERFSTTPYGVDMRVFRASNAINAIQSILAFSFGYAFFRFSNRKSRSASVIPRSRDLLKPYALVAVCQTLSSPISYASLKYVDYVTLLLAKSCKLVPVMIVHLLLYRTKFPTYKYVVVALVTIGVSLFSIYQPQKKITQATIEIDVSHQAWGFFLVGTSLFLDGLCNTTQDRMFQNFRGTGEVSGPHMMVILNSLTSVFSVIGIFASGQLEEVLWFARHHPQVYRDLVLYGFCGAVGQIFIFLTLEHFGSLALITTTVTRKMMSMVLSVVMFNHKLTRMQWFGVAMVFSGIAGEALYKQIKK